VSGRELVSKALGGEPEGARPWSSETWAQFRDASSDDPRWLVEGLLPEGVLAFVSAPPKRGKTWYALALSLSIASGRPLFGEYAIPEPRPILYVALEGARTALRARIGALARGLGIEPAGDELRRLHLLYRPRPFDLADLAAASWLREEADELEAAFVVVDVLRLAAKINENSAEDFARVRDSLEPMLVAGRSVAPLHHFGKLTDTQKERSPGERMAGTGAMHGAADVAFYITKSESGTRRLRVEIEARDFAAPEALGVAIVGTGSGEHGGFRYVDRAQFVLDPTAAEDRDLVAELEELFGDEKWRTREEASKKAGGIGANKDEVLAALSGSPERFVQVEGKRVDRHVNAKPWGTIAMLRDLDRLAQPPEPDEPDSPVRNLPNNVSTSGSPIGEEPEPDVEADVSGLAPLAEPDELRSLECGHADSWLARDGARRCHTCDPPAFAAEVVVEAEILERSPA